MSSLWMLDFSHFDDLLVQPEDREYTCSWRSIEIKGQNPGPISHHTSVVYMNKMYLWGGIIGKDREANAGQIWELDLQKTQWNLIKVVS